VHHSFVVTRCMRCVDAARIVGGRAPCAHARCLGSRAVDGRDSGASRRDHQLCSAGGRRVLHGARQWSDRPASTETAGASTLVADRLEVPSTDGALVPVSLVYDRLAMGALDGHAPLLIEAYGAYGKSTDAAVTPLVMAWIGQGGVYAYAHARGGGEQGDAWHRLATREHKRTIDDVIAAIEALIARRYTSAGRVVVSGTSSGARIPRMVAVQRPELLGAAVFEVGQPDEVRGAQLDPSAARNIAELGDMDTAEGVALLMRASPHHQVPTRVRLPAMLIHSASGDYNCGTGMLVAKYVARLQSANSGDRPVVWVRTGGGHGELFYASPTWGASVLSFLLWQTGDARYQPGRGERR
jgi:prolyl oligopeptidase